MCLPSTGALYKSWYCVLCCVHVMVLCFVLCARHGIVYCAVCMSWYCVLCCVHVMVLCFVLCKRHCHCQSRVLCVLVLHDQNENPCISLTLFFPHHLGITKNHMKIMGQHLVIVSSSTALRDTVTLEEDPGVSEYLFEYLLLCQSAC
jgi:hypothetical protein